MVLCSSTSSQSHQKLKAWLDDDNVKRDFLLATLSSKYPNVIDNLSTKSDLSYADVKQYLFSLQSANQLSKQSTALYTSIKSNKKYYKKNNSNNENSGNGSSGSFGNSKNQRDASEKDKECNWCKKHGHLRVEYTWMNYKKLKEDK